MLKPVEHIRHRPAPGRWPDVAQAARARLFSPLAHRNLRLAQRSWVPAMVPWRASEDGYVNDDVMDWYRRFARGRPGALVVEATGVRDISSGPLLRIGHDRYQPGLEKLVEAVREASDGETRLFIQLIDFLPIRRRPAPATYFARYLKITGRHRRALGAENWSEARVRKALAELDETTLERVLDARELEALQMGLRERVTDTQHPHIRALPRVLPGCFARAALRARDAGFDGVELHYAHAYTLASLLSARNTRGDGYGGAREQRVRLPLEVYHAVRRAVGDKYVVGCRFLSEDCIAGGSSLEDACYFAVALARAGMDFLSLSRGGKFEDARQPKIGEAAYPYTGASGYECIPHVISDRRGPFGRNLEAAAAIRAALRAAGEQTPVVVAGGIHGFEQAERILARGQADLVGVARQALADPDWFLKIRLGHGDAIRTCSYSNYCEGLDQRHKQVTCQLWDRVAMDESGVKRSKDGRRRLVAPAWTPPARADARNTSTEMR